MANFLLPEFKNLTESTSIALAECVECVDIATPLSVQNIATTFVRQGAGDVPVLLLHGFDSSIFEFRRLLPLLTEKTETLAVDLLGFGFTSRLDDIAFSPETIKTHLYYFWKTLIGKPVILVGASMGGAAAIDFTLTYPEAVQKLVLIDSAGMTSGPAIGKFMVPPLGYLATEFLRNTGVRRSISRKAYFDESLASEDAVWCAKLHLKMPSWNQALIAFTKSGGYACFGDKLAQITQPTLILWGENDRILGTGDAAKFAAGIAGSKLIWVKNCGHVPHLEQAAITAQSILDFIGGG